MSDIRRDPFAESAPAYALGALDPAEARAFEAHLASCAACQAEVDAYRQVAAGIGASSPSVAPPPELKAKVIAGASRQGSVRAFDRPIMTAPAARRSSALWLAAAASMAIHIGLGAYAWSVRAQLTTARQLASDAAEYSARLRRDLAAARGEAAMGSRLADVLSAPDVRRVVLNGARPDVNGQGLAYWSPTRGLWLAGDNLPVPAPGRIYQLWLVVPNSAPIGAGLLPVNPNGSGQMVQPPRPGLDQPRTGSVTFAVTDEPAGGSPGPTTPILLAGTIKTE